MQALLFISAFAFGVSAFARTDSNETVVTDPVKLAGIIKSDQKLRADAKAYGYLDGPQRLANDLKNDPQHIKASDETIKKAVQIASGEMQGPLIGKTQGLDGKAIKLLFSGGGDALRGFSGGDKGQATH